MKREILDCECFSLDHSYVLTYDDDLDGSKCVYIEPHLSTGGFWHRLKYAVKYLFGWKCRYGCFDEIIITKNNYKPLKNVIKYLEENNSNK